MGAKEAGGTLWEGHLAPHRGDGVLSAFSSNPRNIWELKGKEGAVTSRDREC